LALQPVLRLAWTRDDWRLEMIGDREDWSLEMKRFGRIGILEAGVLHSVLVLMASMLLGIVGFGQTPVIQNPAGVEMKIDPSNSDPALSVTVPDGSPNDRSFKILLPEHVTVRPHGEVEGQHLYIYGHDGGSKAPKWKRVGNALEYERDFGPIHFAARATLVDDGILFRYDFVNTGVTDYDMVTAVTDPRFHTVFYDPRLERTYVHHKDGFALLASHTPERLTMSLAQWFPVRYLASYTAGIPNDLVQRPGDHLSLQPRPGRCAHDCNPVGGQGMGGGKLFERSRRRLDEP
jgi:hypothetical protein